MKLQPRKVKKEDKIKYLDSLYTAVSSLGSREEIKNFLKDVLTESERIMIGRRILIARMLLDDKSYEQITGELHVGYDTIMRVHRRLEDDRDGYEKAISGLRRVVEKRLGPEGEGDGTPYSFGWLKKRYPLHFLLFNLLEKNGK